MFKYAIFDLDGTLTDSGEGITKSAQFALAQQGIVEPDLDKLKCFIGPPLHYSFMNYYGMDEEAARRAVQDFRKRYAPIGIYENQIYPGIEAMLKNLRDSGIRLLVASSKPEAHVYTVLEHFNIKDYFSGISGASFDESNASKTAVLEGALWMIVSLEEGEEPSTHGARSLDEMKPPGSRQELEDALASFGIDRTNCAMVGDRHYDITAARDYSLTALGVGFGFAQEGELEAAGAEAVAADSRELLSLLKKMGTYDPTVSSASSQTSSSADPKKKL